MVFVREIPQLLEIESKFCAIKIKHCDQIIVYL